MPADSTLRRPGQSRFWMVLAVLVIAELTCALETSMISVALAHLYGLYGDPVRVTWLITAYSLTAAGTVAICSRLGDLYGRRRMLMVMLVLAATGSLTSAFASDLNVIIFGRALQGASMAILPLAFGILREMAADKRQLNIGVGVLGGTYSFSTGTGIVLAGVIVDRAEWQDMFLLSAGVAIVALGLVWRTLAKDRPRTGARGRADFIGGVGIVFPITALLLGLNSGKAEGWDSALTWSLIVGGLITLAVWATYELRHPNPMIDLRLLAVRQIAIVNLLICVFTMGPLIYPQVLLPLLQQPLWTGVGLGISATLAGLVKAPTNITAGVAAISSGYLAQKLTFRPIIILATMANLLAWLILIARHDSIWLLVGVAVLLIAPAGTIIFGCAPSLIIEAAPEDRTSEATGMTSVLRSIAMAVGSQMLALTLASSQVINAEGVKYPDEQAYLATFIAVAACSVAALICALLIPGGRRRATVPAPVVAG